MRICNMTKIICLNPTISKYPAKSDFFIRLQIFLYASYNFLPPEELPPHAKNDECVYLSLKIWSRKLHNWHFLETFEQIQKKIKAA